MKGVTMQTGTWLGGPFDGTRFEVTDDVRDLMVYDTVPAFWSNEIDDPDPMLPSHPFVIVPLRYRAYGAHGTSRRSLVADWVNRRPN